MRWTQISNVTPMWQVVNGFVSARHSCKYIFTLNESGHVQKDQTAPVFIFPLLSSSQSNTSSGKFHYKYMELVPLFLLPLILVPHQIYPNSATKNPKITIIYSTKSVIYSSIFSSYSCGVVWFLVVYS